MIKISYFVDVVPTMQIFHEHSAIFLMRLFIKQMSIIYTQIYQWDQKFTQL